MASVNLIDRERQWSKSAMGFEAEDVLAKRRSAIQLFNSRTVW